MSPSWRSTGIGGLKQLRAFSGWHKDTMMEDWWFWEGLDGNCQHGRDPSDSSGVVQQLHGEENGPCFPSTQWRAGTVCAACLYLASVLLNVTRSDECLFFTLRTQRVGQVTLRLEMRRVLKGISNSGTMHFVAIKISAEWTLDRPFIRKETRLSLPDGYSRSGLHWATQTHRLSRKRWDSFKVRLASGLWDNIGILHPAFCSPTSTGLGVMEEVCSCGTKHYRWTLLSSLWGNFLTCSFAFKIGAENKAFRNF